MVLTIQFCFPRYRVRNPCFSRNGEFEFGACTSRKALDFITTNLEEAIEGESCTSANALGMNILIQGHISL